MSLLTGEVHPTQKRFLRAERGGARTEDGCRYELATDLGRGTPILRSLQRGKWCQSL
jgi:hypothetical protein